VSACQTAPPKDPPALPAETIAPPAATPPPPPVTDVKVAAPNEASNAEPAEARSCTCVDSSQKPSLTLKPKRVVHSPAPAPPAVAPVPPPAASGEASVIRVEDASASILGKRVRGQDGEDLGRVVDILADRRGRVRIAVIEFGGFLGVGNRRIAVDWSLLKFQPSDADAPVMVKVSRAKLQGTPEYRGAERPLALMAPGAAASAPPAAPK
jgi:hypothetical protein